MESGADVGLCFGGVPALRGGKLPFLVSSMESYDVVDEKLAPLAHMYQSNTLVYMWYSERAVFTYTSTHLVERKGGLWSRSHPEVGSCRFETANTLFYMWYGST